MIGISWLKGSLKAPADTKPSTPQPSVLPKTGYKHWHKHELEYAYGRCIQEFEHYRFSPEDIERLRVEQLSAKEFKTSSNRIQLMIVAAFYVGKMRGIRESDEMFAKFSPS